MSSFLEQIHSKFTAWDYLITVVFSIAFLVGIIFAVLSATENDPEKRKSNQTAAYITFTITGLAAIGFWIYSFLKSDAVEELVKERMNVLAGEKVSAAEKTAQIAAEQEFITSRAAAAKSAKLAELAKNTK
jgi:cytochrome bd-type quinol oxidase subunit 2